MTTERLRQLEGHASRGEFVQAILEAERLLMVPDLSVKERGRLYRLAGRARGKGGDPYGGLKVLELAIPWALRARDWDCVGMARAELGVSWLSVGDSPNAIDQLQSYLLDFKRYSEARSYLGHVHYNLGLAYRRRREHRLAAEHYLRAVGWFTEKGYTVLAGKTHQNLAWLYCLEGAAPEAEQEIVIAETFAQVCGPEFQVEQLVCRSHLHKVTGHVGEAMKLVQEVLQPGRPGSTVSHKANAAWIAGVVGLAVHNLDSAQFFANLATHYAIEARDTGVMSQASILKGEIARARGADEAAG